MTELARVDAVDEVLRRAGELCAKGDYRGALDLLVNANRLERSSELEVAIVEVRFEGGQHGPPLNRSAVHAPVGAQGAGGEIVEVDASELTVSAVREGFARSGCLHVRGLVGPERAVEMASGIDAALAAFDAWDAGDRSVDPAWYKGRPIKDRAGTTRKVRRKITREHGSLWSVYSPRMLYEIFDVVDESGLGQVMSGFLGERPVLSANKCTLRRVPCEDMLTGWHQDGSFLGDDIGSFNFWLALTRCGVDAPGLDIVPKRFSGVLPSGGAGAVFDWSLSDQTVRDAADGVPIVRPEFEAGDALLFDHRLVHRTASSAKMVRERHAIESWFFTPSKYPPDGQVPLLY